MNDLARQNLKTLVGRYGQSLAYESTRCEGLLRDTCPSCSREIFVLVNAVRQHIPKELLAPHHGLPLPLMKGFLAKRLSDELGFSDDAARWAVESWAEALGLIDPQGQKADTRKVPGNTPVIRENPPASDDPVVRVQRERWADDLVSENAGSRLAAVDGLLHTGDDECIRLLIAALGNDQLPVRIAAFDALSSLGRQIVPTLIDALDVSGDDVAARAVLVLGGLEDYRAVGPLVRQLDRTGTVRAGAIWALGEIGSPDASTALLRFISDPDPAVSREAETALAKIGSKKSRRSP